MTHESAEYKSYERFITADKRYRKFIYALSAIFFILVVVGLYQVQQNIEHKIDGLVDGAVARSNTRTKEQETIAKETIRYITCIFVVPIDQRTVVTQEKCFQAADLPGGLSRDDFSPIVVPDAISTSASATPAQPSTVSVTSTSSSPNIIVPQPSSQPNTSQPTASSPPQPKGLSALPLVGRIFKALGL